MIVRIQNSIPQVKSYNLYIYVIENFLQHPKDQSVDQRNYLPRQYLDIALIPGQYLGITLVAGKYIALHWPLICPRKVVHIRIYMYVYIYIHILYIHAYMPVHT